MNPDYTFFHCIVNWGYILYDQAQFIHHRWFVIYAYDLVTVVKSDRLLNTAI